MTHQTLEPLLSELAEWIQYEGIETVQWLVCGGAALALQQLQSRTTRDVDVLAGWDPERRQLVLLTDLPPSVESCIERVARDHPELQGLGKRWINLGASRLAEAGLPAGFESRLAERRFGSHLTLHLLGRYDLMVLKLFAAADDRSRRQDVHFEDLRVLNPSYAELDEAVKWVRRVCETDSRPARGFPQFEHLRTELKDVVTRLGHDDLAYYI